MVLVIKISMIVTGPIDSIIIVGNLTTIKMIMMITTTIIISQGEINIQ